MSTIIALVGYLILAVVCVLDKFILTKSVQRPVVFVFYSTIFVLPILLLALFGARPPQNVIDWILTVVSGFAFAFGLWTMYIGFQESEISHAGPFVGGITTLFVFILSAYFLGEKLSLMKIFGVVILIVGCLVISFEKSEKNNGWHKGMVWGVVAGIMFAVSHVSAKYVYDVYGFYRGFVWTRGMLGVFGLCLLFMPGVWMAVFGKNKNKAIKSVSNGSRKFILVSIDKILGVLGVIFIQYAIAIGSVTLVNALIGIQFAILILLVALLSRFRPKLFKEYYTRFEIVSEIAAIVLIGSGMGMILVNF